MTNLINKFGIGALTLALAGSLNGCYKRYNLDGEIVKYNKSLSEPLKVKTGDSIFVYRTSSNKDSVEGVYTYPCSSKGCKISEAQTYNKFGKGKERINEYQEKFNKYINKINLIENKNKK